MQSSGLKKLKNFSKTNRELLAQADIIIARSIEKKGDWEEAEIMYTAIMEEFSDTSIALRVPLLMAIHYDQPDNEQSKEQMKKIYTDALSSYQNILSDQGSRSALIKKKCF